MDFLLGVEGRELLGRHSQRRAKWDLEVQDPGLGLVMIQSLVSVFENSEKQEFLYKIG